MGSPEISASEIAASDVPAATPPTTDVPAEKRSRRIGWKLLRGFSAFAVAVLFGWLTFYLSTRNNDFPVQYHPDEWSKVYQIQDNAREFNFNHPLLMLRAARIYVDLVSPPQNVRDLDIAGRNTSAILTAVTVFSLSLAAFATCGFAGLLIAGVALSSCQSLIVHAHYFKEDTSLVVGIAVTVLGAAFHCASRRWWNKLLAAIVLGAGCALAASGKYVGIAVVAPAIATLLISRISKWWLTLIQLVLMLAAATSLAVWINLDAFEDPWSLKLRPEVANHIDNEYGHATGSEWMHGIMVIKTPSLFCTRLAALEMRPHLWVIVALAIVGWCARPWCSRWMLSVMFFLAAFMIVLAYNAIPIPRYALPLTVLGYFAAAVCIAAVIEKRVKQNRVRIAIIALILLIIGGFQYRACAKINHQFADDSRQRLREWIATSLPANAIIVGERYTGLDNMGDPWRFPKAPRPRQVIIPCNFAADYQSFDNLKRRRINYIAIAEPAYGRYLFPECVGVRGDEEQFDQYCKFYRHLLNDVKPVWQSDPDPPSGSYVNPIIRVYEIVPPPPMRK